MQDASEPTPQLLQQQHPLDRFTETLFVEMYCISYEPSHTRSQHLIDELDFKLQRLGLNICPDGETLTNRQQRPILYYLKSTAETK
jgi:hypothetical protein